MVLNATFNSISVISWWSVLLMDETGVPGENHRYYNVIMQQLNGEMRPYLKSNGGEQGSVLNGRLPGLFFTLTIRLKENKDKHNICQMIFSRFYIYFF
jgi:hypothetical protein